MILKEKNISASGLVCSLISQVRVLSLASFYVSLQGFCLQKHLIESRCDKVCLRDRHQNQSEKRKKRAHRFLCSTMRSGRNDAFSFDGLESSSSRIARNLFTTFSMLIPSQQRPSRNRLPLIDAKLTLSSTRSITQGNDNMSRR